MPYSFCYINGYLAKVIRRKCCTFLRPFIIISIISCIIFNFNTILDIFCFIIVCLFLNNHILEFIRRIAILLLNGFISCYFSKSLCFAIIIVSYNTRSFRSVFIKCSNNRHIPLVVFFLCGSILIFPLIYLFS